MNNSVMRIRTQLLRLADEKMSRPKEKIVPFTDDAEADVLLNDLTRHPHAFVMGCISDRQMPAKKAWRLPYGLRQRLGYFDIRKLSRLSWNEIWKEIRRKPCLHRLHRQMAKSVYSAIQRIRDDYSGDASKIWSDKPASAMLVYRFLEFDGIGPKLATMAANILVRSFRIKVNDKYSIDISADVHVRRVFRRLGLVPEGASLELVIYRARELNPEYPGIFDFAVWEIGQKHCHPRDPDCGECPLDSHCAHMSTGARK